uniref:Cuticular protein 134 n=1 Tax=Leptinotarsa decemlineata TaxID=7539 RepID=A0A3Q8HGI1_LEPDE|nr:cuticular protein 134 [Leptinotarsa decemlineata]
MIGGILLFIIISDERRCSSAKEQNSHSFSYSINSGEVISHHSEETNWGVVRGSFSFLQPDGQIRVVQYQADEKSGFKVAVHYRRFLTKLMGHLRFPKDFSRPIILVAPVGLITSELFESGSAELNFEEVK